MGQFRRNRTGFRVGIAIALVVAAMGLLGMTVTICPMIAAVMFASATAVTAAAATLVLCGRIGLLLLVGHITRPTLFGAKTDIGSTVYAQSGFSYGHAADRIDHLVHSPTPGRVRG